MVPPAVVKSGNSNITGTGTSVPHLKGTAAPLRETSRIDKALGAAWVSVSTPALPVSRVPPATRLGSPSSPGKL